MRPINPTDFDILSSAEFIAPLHPDFTGADPLLRRVRREERGKLRRRARHEAIARKHAWLIEG